MESDGKLVFGYTAVWSFHCYGIDTVICIVFKEPGERHGVYSTCLCSQSWRHISHPADSGGGFLRGARNPHLEGNYCNVVCWHSNLRPKNHDLQYPTFASHAYDISVKALVLIWIHISHKSWWYLFKMRIEFDVKCHPMTWELTAGSVTAQFTRIPVTAHFIVLIYGRIHIGVLGP